MGVHSDVGSSCHSHERPRSGRMRHDAHGLRTSYSEWEVIMPDLDIDLASGVAAFEAKEFRRAMQLLSPLAESGRPEAQFRLAVMFQNGLGVVPNESQAYRWMRAAAEQGYGLAQHGLGFMYLEGECTDQDEAEAATWFRRAAEQGLVGSMTTLALMYEQGRGVAPDPEEAKRLYDRAGFNT